MYDDETLINVLWIPFLDQIRKGKGAPVYFTFHRQFLDELFKQNNVNCNSFELINKVANTYYEVLGNNKVIIKSSAFIPLAGNFSPVIILVCQQVLAVEEMVRDERGHSEDAYFPRLRKMISPCLKDLSSNPFEFSEFKKIWKTLKQELMTIEGFNEKLVNFDFTNKSRKNKARSVPLRSSSF